MNDHIHNINVDAETKELFFQLYSKTYDFALVSLKLGLNSDQIISLKDDDAFMNRLTILDVAIKEKMFSSLLSLLDAENPHVKLRAIESLGKILYPERFDDSNKIHSDIPANINVTLTGGNR